MELADCRYDLFLLNLCEIIVERQPEEAITHTFGYRAVASTATHALTHL